MDVPIHWFIIAQVFGLAGLVVVFMAFQAKDKTRLLVLDGIANILMAICYLAMGSFVLAVVNVIAAVRDIVFVWLGKRRRDKSISLASEIAILVGFWIVFAVAIILTWDTWIDFVILGLVIVYVFSLWNNGTHLVRILCLLLSVVFTYVNIMAWNAMGIVVEVVYLVSIVVFYIRLAQRNKNRRRFKMNLKELNPHRILGAEFTGQPGYISLAEDSEYIDLFANAEQQELNDFIQRYHRENNITWSLSGNRENRVSLYRQNADIINTGRTIHLGIDINAPAGTLLHSPLDGEVVKAEYEAGPGNYGWFCVLKCDIGRGGKSEPIYLFFGHLAKQGLAKVGTKVNKGDVFAQIGDMHENGNWFHHTHFQVITQRGFEQGWVYKALCTPEQLKTIDDLVPCPMGFVS